MTLTIGVLTWKAHETLINSLKSYSEYGLDKLADQRLLLAQETSEEDRKIARLYGYDIIQSEENIGIAKGYKALVHYATSEFFLFLENDWQLIAPPEEQISYAQHMLEAGYADVVRLRHRWNPGSPLYTRQFAGRELDKPTHLLDSVHWLQNPDELYPEYILKAAEGFYYARAKNANWTNNPTMFRTEDLKWFLEKFGEGDVERDIQSWWETQDFIVAQGDGLFTHNRLDR